MIKIHELIIASAVLKHTDISKSLLW